jgi:hypothetical protein
MTLQTSGPISLQDIEDEFGGTGSISISEYYGVDDGVPSSGAISFSDFYGTSSYYMPTATILSSFASPGGYPFGLAFDGTNLISCDNASDLIYVHDGVSSAILSSFASPGTYPFGLAFEGTNLISSDSDSDLIYVHKREDEI